MAARAPEPAAVVELQLERALNILTQIVGMRLLAVGVGLGLWGWGLEAPAGPGKGAGPGPLGQMALEVFAPKCGTRALLMIHHKHALACLPVPPLQAWKSLQLGVLTLWNACARNGAMERHVVERGVTSKLLSIINTPTWPPSLRDTACGCLEFMMERWVGLG